MCGFHAVKNVVITPIATGMTFNLVLQALKIKKVIWLRCDQKSVPKALHLAGCDVKIIDCKVVSWDTERLESFKKWRTKSMT